MSQNSLESDPNNVIDWTQWPPPSQKDEDNFPIFFLSNAYAKHVFNRIASFDEMSQISLIYGEIYGYIKTFTKLSERLSMGAERKGMEYLDNVFVASYDKLTEMFRQKYLEEHVVTDFCRYVMEHASNWKNSTHIAPYAAMIQSSGTGKTRLIKESGDLMWLFYICCRHDKSTGFPRRSAVIPKLNDITNLANGSHQTAGVLLSLHILFLTACLNRLLDFIKTLPVPASSEQIPNAIDKKYFVTWREMQLDGTETQLIGSAFWNDIYSRLESLVNEQMPAFSNVLSMPTEQEEKLYIAKSQALLEQTSNSVQFEISRRCSGQNCVLFAFDEAHQLMLMEMLKTTNSFFLIRRALSKLPDAGMLLLKFLLIDPKNISESTDLSFFNYARYSR